jgi:hypothetical protein
MSTIYRKSGGREFYKVDESTGIVTRVWNKQSFSRIDISDNRLVLEDTMDEGTTEITAEEFNTAYKEALERITTGKI